MMNAVDADFQERCRVSSIRFIPEGWNEKTLLDAVGMKRDLIVAGPFGSNLKVSDYRDEGIPIIRLQNIDYGKFIDKEIKYISPEKARELVYHSFRAGDLVLAKLGDPIGKTCKVPDYFKDGIVVADVVRIRIENGWADTKFIMYSLNSVATKNQLINGKIGSTRPRVNLDQIRGIRVLVPPLNQQRKIVAILSSVDAAIEQTDAIIAQTERMKKGLMQELLTKGIKHTVFKKTSIGRIPEKWDVIYLGNNNYFDLVTGGTPSTKNKRYWENGDIPWLLSGEIHKKRVYNTQKKISKLGYENSNATLLPKQSVLIALAGQGKTRGTTAITEIELTTNQSVAAIVSNFNYLNPYYVFYILDSMYEELRSKSSGSGRAGLSLNILREIGLPLPSLSEQNQIASTLLSVDDKLIIEKNRRIQLGRLKKGLMQDLLTGRVRVKVEDDHA